MRRIIAALLLLLGCVGPTQAGLVLTAAGTADGFTLSTYYTGINNGNFGSYSLIAAAPLNGSSSTLATIDYQDGLLRSFADVNGQVYGGALNSVSFPSAINIANAGGQTYATQLNGGISKVSNTLGLTPVTVTGGWSATYGFAGNPVTGDLLAVGTGSAGYGLYDINPLTGANTRITPA